jgi:hypothetical protein
MDFQQYLAKQRKQPHFVTMRATNPHAEDLAKDLNRHIATIRAWVNGSTWSAKMLDAMIFFNATFPGKYLPTKGRTVWRGQGREVFDGSPRSYSYSRKHAEWFAGNEADCSPFAKQCFSYMIERRVCFSCKDSEAFKISLDLKKVLKQYTDNPFGDEHEVVLLNTRPHGSGKLWTVEVG